MYSQETERELANNECGPDTEELPTVGYNGLYCAPVQGSFIDIDQNRSKL